MSSNAPGPFEPTELEQLMVRVRRDLSAAIRTGQPFQATLHVGSNANTQAERDVRLDVTFTSKFKIRGAT